MVGRTNLLEVQTDAGVWRLSTDLPDGARIISVFAKYELILLQQSGTP